MSECHQLRERIDRWYDDWFATDRLYSEWARRNGITNTTLFTLYVIARTGGCSPCQIATRLAMSKQTVGSALDVLERRGYIVRDKSDEDGRGRVVRFTREGEAYAMDILSRLSEAENKAFESLEGDEVDGMIGANKRLANALQKELAGRHG